MTRTLETSVVIIGGGPVGLCLAMDLAWRGVEVVVIERREAGEPPSVKCNHVSSRTMETFRRLGFVDQVRAAGLPDDYPNDVVVRTRATGYELMRIHIPCRRDRYKDTSGPDGWWPTPEPAHRVNQIFLEPVLFESARRSSGVTILNRTEFTGFEQDADGVTAQALDLDSGEEVRIRARYLVGCEGGRSLVRKAIGATLKGREVIQRVQSSYIRAPGLYPRITKPDAWMSYLYAPQRSGNLVAIDGREPGWSTITCWLTKMASIRSTATGASAPCWAWTRPSNTSCSARRTGSAGGWWRTASGIGGPSSAETPPTSGSPMQAMA